MKKAASLLLIIAIISALYLVLISPFKGALPQQFVIAVTIIASVALFGTVLSLCLRKQNKNFA